MSQHRGDRIAVRGRPRLHPGVRLEQLHGPGLVLARQGTGQQRPIVDDIDRDGHQHGHNRDREHKAGQRREEVRLQPLRSSPQGEEKGRNTDRKRRQRDLRWIKREIEANHRHADDDQGRRRHAREKQIQRTRHAADDASAFLEGGP